MIHDSAQDIETASRGLRLGAFGWKHPDWRNDFYPDDLPEDWQLSYYANEFSCVLVPASYWAQQPLDVEQMLDDVPDDFVFYLQGPTNHDEQTALRDVIDQLGQRLGGIITDRPLASVGSELQYCYAQPSDQARGIWTPHHPASSGVAVLSLQQSDIRTWRRWLERFSESAGGDLKALLVSDDEPEMQQLQQLKTLLELMGF